MIFARLIGIVPLGIGLTVLIGVWAQPFGAFHSPPLFFRVFASFIAFGFILVGSAFLFGGIVNRTNLADHLKSLQSQLDIDSNRSNGASESADLTYGCTACGAPLEDGADVSPHGDVKCSHCGKWYNVHQA